MKNFKESFLDLALTHAEAKYQGFERVPFDENRLRDSVKISNKAVSKIKILCKNAKENGELVDLIEFINHENKYIRCLAATYYLFVDKEMAVKILEELEKLPVPNYVDAYTVLHAFRRRVLEL
ncbi:MAG: hypothetical protein ACK5B9_15025 [Flavobacteriia bacterium]|jgi:hypothetical protein